MLKINLRNIPKFFVLESIPGWVNMTMILILLLDIILIVNFFYTIQDTIFSINVIYILGIITILPFILQKFKWMDFSNISIDKLRIIMIFTLPIMAVISSFGLMAGTIFEGNKYKNIAILLVQLSNFLVILTPFILKKIRSIKYILLVPALLNISIYFWYTGIDKIIMGFIQALDTYDYSNARICLNVIVWIVVNLFIIYLLLCDSKKKVRNE